jgi:PBSX family phage terminase large subunit
MQSFNKTEKQRLAIDILSSPAKYIMLYGGSRSGKTFILLYSLIIRAAKAKSRHVILRYKFNHAKTSIWLDTLPKVVSLCFPELSNSLVWQSSDFFLKLPNGSEIWVSGLDDSIRVEKILGKEYSTIFFNECSQIPYKSVQTALTRLAEKNELKNRAYFDENPPQKSHWSYSVFIKLKNPDTWQTLDEKKYTYMRMNPEDNLDNIDKEYIDILQSLSPKERQRFLSGEFQDAAEGAIFYAFNSEQHVKRIDNISTPMKMGCDFNVNPIVAVAGYYQNNIIHITDEIYRENANTFMLANEAVKRWGGIDCYPDSTGISRKSSANKTDIQILKDAGLNVKPTCNPHVADRNNCVNALFGNNRLFIDPGCRWLIKDLEQLTHNNKDPMLGHISDALGYLCWALEPMLAKPKLSVRY